MLACLTTVDIANTQSFTTFAAADIANLAPLLDVTSAFTFYSYIFLRRVNNAINNCGDYGNILPVIHIF